MTKNEVIIQQFLKAWLAWAKVAPKRENVKPFSTLVGLCDSLSYWLLEQGFSLKEIGEVTEEFAEMLFKDFQDTLYPFGDLAYMQDYEHGTQHMNKERLAWVESKLKGGK